MSAVVTTDLGLTMHDAAFVVALTELQLWTLDESGGGTEVFNLAQTGSKGGAGGT